MIFMQSHIYTGWLVQGSFNNLCGKSYFLYHIIIFLE